MLLQMRLQLLHGHPIDARSAFVRHHPMAGPIMFSRLTIFSISRTSTSGGEGCGLAVAFGAPDSCSDGFRPLPSERA
jgi:hypothetical protein